MDIKIITKNCPDTVVDPEKSKVQAALVHFPIQWVRSWGPLHQQQIIICMMYQLINFLFMSQHITQKINDITNDFCTTGTTSMILVMCAEWLLNLYQHVKSKKVDVDALLRWTERHSRHDCLDKKSQCQRLKSKTRKLQKITAIKEMVLWYRNYSFIVFLFVRIQLNTPRTTNWGLG